MGVMGEGDPAGRRCVGLVRRQAAQSFNHPADRIDGLLDLLFCSHFAQRKADSPHSPLHRYIHGLENRRNRYAVAVAGGAGRCSHLLQLIQYGVSLQLMKTETERIGQTFLRMAVALQAGEPAAEAVIKTITQLRLMRHVVYEIPTGYLASRPQSDDLEHVLSAGPEIALVVGAVHLLFERDSATNIKGADALGRVQFMAGDGKQIHSQFIDAHSDFAHRLCGVAMEHRPACVSHGRQFSDGLDCADLVVGMHDADQQSVRP